MTVERYTTDSEKYSAQVRAVYHDKDTCPIGRNIPYKLRSSELDGKFYCDLCKSA
jgi:hypothetical protein